MKALFINPPTWFNMFPPLALPIIAGYLESIGHEATVIDLNIEFFHYIFSKQFIDTFIELYKKLEQDTAIYIQSGDKSDLKEQKVKIFQYIKDYSAKTTYDVFKTEEYCKEYVRVTSDINLYFDSWKLKIYHYKIIIYCELLLKLQIIYPEIFNEFFDEKIAEILNLEADYIGFSMSDVDQFFYSIMLAKKLKKKTNIPICFGGTCVNYFYDKKIKNKVSFHKNVADFIMFGAGEFPHEDMANYIDGKLDISKVRNIEYLDKNNKIRRNTKVISGYLKKYYTKFDDLDLSKYYTPELVLSVETTKGCYWNKCAFCTRASLHAGFQSRYPEDVADDIELLNKKYNVKYFHLMDDCVPVAFAKKLAQCIIDKNIKVYLMTFMRFEKKMTKEYLQKLYDAGMRLIIWGLESPSQDRLNNINKGLNMDIVNRILKDCKEIGIKSNVTFIVDFPNETEEELQYTLGYIKDNIDYISFVQIHQFTLLENTPMFENPNKYNIPQEFIEKTIKNGGYAKYHNPDKYENILENTSIQGMMRGAPPLCLYTTGGSLLYTMRDKIINEG